MRGLRHLILAALLLAPISAAADSRFLTGTIDAAAAPTLTGGENIPITKGGFLKRLPASSAVQSLVNLQTGTLIFPSGKSIAVQGSGVFQVGGGTGPYMFNDTALDTISFQALPGALPSGNATNIQVYPPQPGDAAWLNLTAKASGGGEERLLIGAPGSAGNYRFSQVFTGTGVCHQVDFSDGAHGPAFSLDCNGHLLLANGSSVWSTNAAASAAYSLLYLDGANNLSIGYGTSGSQISLINFYGALHIPNNISIYAQNAANSAALSMMFLGGDNAVWIGYPSSPIHLKGTIDIPQATWTDTQTCSAGQISIDANYIYACTATNTVKRAALSTF